MKGWRGSCGFLLGGRNFHMGSEEEEAAAARNGSSQKLIAKSLISGGDKLRAPD